MTRKRVGQPTLSASPAAPQPVGQTLRWVIGAREATGELRLQGDCAPVSRNLFKWTGQAGPPRAGVTGPRPPAWPDPGPRGSPAPLLNRDSWRQGSGRRESGGEAVEGSDGCAYCLPDHFS